MIEAGWEMAGLYWHTLRHLRPVQFAGRIRKALDRRKPDLTPSGLAPRPRTGDWVDWRERTPSICGPATFRFLGEPGMVETAAGWNDPARTKLWLYNLHYFDDLRAQGALARRSWHQDLIERWITENPPPFGNGWEPYPIARRCVNWIASDLAHESFETSWRENLALQTRWLRRHVEWHLLGNHLFADLVALLFAGCYFEGREAEEWHQFALAHLETQLVEQRLADGGHFELSPMYHAAWLFDLLDLVNLARAYPDSIPENHVESWKKAVHRGLSWLSVMCHPDGEPSFFNDTAIGIAPSLSALKGYAGALGLQLPPKPANGLTDIGASGYWRWQEGDAVCLIDAAAVGPDYLPGHAHADTLSFELSIDGHRLFVNSGTSVYGEDDERQRQRSTAAHNTVEVDGISSSEVWAGFRVARRARILDRRSEIENGVTNLSASHDGYRRLPGRVVHERRWDLTSGRMTVRDRLHGRFESAVARLHVHPAVRIDSQQDRGTIGIPGGRKLVWSCEGANATISPSSWHPRFGESVPSSMIELRFNQPEIVFSMSW